MASALTTSPIPAGPHKAPALENGDHLTRSEFELRYADMPHGIKAELIEGVVYMAPPVRYDPHGTAHSLLHGLLYYYVAKSPGLRLPGDNCTVRLGIDDEPQPDLFLMLPPHLGGKAIVDRDGYVIGPPALVCEIAASSVNIDLHGKKAAYRRNGVQEYLVWRTEDAAIDWFSLEAGDYLPIPPQADGTLCSKAFPGLCLRPSSLIDADIPAIFAMLDKTTATPEHAAFAAMLQRDATTPKP